MKKVELETECGTVTTVWVEQDLKSVNVDGEPFTSETPQPVKPEQTTWKYLNMLNPVSGAGYTIKAVDGYHLERHDECMLRIVPNECGENPHNSAIAFIDVQHLGKFELR